MRLYHILIALLFFILPLIHGKLLPTLGIDISFDVAGNFEFTKALFFNISASLIFVSYLTSKKEKDILLGRSEVGIGVILIASTLFSLSPFISLIGDLEKGHTSIMFLNLLGLFLLLKHEKRVYLKRLVYISLCSLGLICTLGFKEYIYPSYSYGALGDRMLGSFGHPNYFAGYLLLLLPYTLILQNSLFRYIIYALTGTCIVLTQSILAIFLCIGLSIYSLRKEIKLNTNKTIYACIGCVLCMSIIGGLVIYFPEKLHSFLSRFYLWETTIAIIFSDLRIFFFGAGLETLPYFFDSFKPPELYIYENYGYTADRPHNFLLNIFYHFGIFGVTLFSYILYKFYKTFSHSPHHISILLFLSYGVFHYFSISSYIILVLSLVYCYKSEQTLLHDPLQWKYYTKIILFLILIISCIGGYFSYILYRAELHSHSKNYTLALQTFPHPKYLRTHQYYNTSQQYESITSPTLLKHQINNTPNKQELCETLVSTYPAVEHYFYCGKIFETLQKDKLAKDYYSVGLQKLPDLWNPDSPYWDRYFIKNTITGNRFFSEKFGNLNHILEFVGK